MEYFFPCQSIFSLQLINSIWFKQILNQKKYTTNTGLISIELKKDNF